LRSRSIEVVENETIALLGPPFMARGAVGWRKWAMAYRIKQIFLRSAMGIMTGDARFRPRPDPLMGVGKICGILFVAFGAELTA